MSKPRLLTWPETTQGESNRVKSGCLRRIVHGDRLLHFSVGMGRFLIGLAEENYSLHPYYQS